MLAVKNYYHRQWMGNRQNYKNTENFLCVQSTNQQQCRKKVHKQWKGDTLKYQERNIYTVAVTIWQNQPEDINKRLKSGLLRLLLI